MSCKDQVTEARTVIAQALKTLNVVGITASITWVREKLAEIDSVLIPDVVKGDEP